METRKHSDVIIIGASAAGLAVAACLKEEGITSITILEQATQVASAWRNHYDRLHLHTDKRNSNLPYLSFPADVPQYPTREQVVQYLEQYAQHFELRPEFAQKAVAVERMNGLWHISTTTRQYSAKKLVFATGYADNPVIPNWPGKESYTGQILHSSRYKNGRPFKEQDVLVVGFGNSGGEIAIDLWENGARPSISVRSPVNVIPRDLLGIPILSIGIALSKLPSKLADTLSAPILKAAIGDLSKYGLRKLPYGPITQIKRDGRIPLLDIGTVSLIKQGSLKILPDIKSFTRDRVEFADGYQSRFDAVILATGYRPGLASFTMGLGEALHNGRPVCSGKETSLPGLYFCGFYVSPTGMLREIGVEAKKISKDIKAKL